jgi:hypothetical protein
MTSGLTCTSNQDPSAASLALCSSDTRGSLCSLAASAYARKGGASLSSQIAKAVFTLRGNGVILS